jgi:hypothetical protein
LARQDCRWPCLFGPGRLRIDPHHDAGLRFKSWYTHQIEKPLSFDVGGFFHCVPVAQKLSLLKNFKIIDKNNCLPTWLNLFDSK